MVTINDTPTILDAALDALRHGFAVVPPAEDGTKRPMGEWKKFQQHLPGADDVIGWYSAGRTGIGVVTGAVSGNLEMLEFEGRAVEEDITEAFADLAAAAGLTDLVNRINAGYCETTPTGGLHLLYRVTGAPVAGNTKLARRPATPAELAEKPDDPIRVLIETRGEGGYVVVAPSHGSVHATGDGWVLLNGGFDQVAVITADERDELHRIAKALDTLPGPAAPTSTMPGPAAVFDIGDGDRPGDAYNHDPAAASRTLQLLERHGWTQVFTRPHDGHDDIHLRRPGKNIGTSAVLHMDAGTLVNFSSSVAGFDQEAGYTPFAVYTLLEHGGDYQAAARHLRPHGPTDDLSWAHINGSTPHATTVAAKLAADGAHLPDEFWASRAALQHIRAAARSRLVAPDAVLGAILARVAAITPHMVEIPAIVGSPIGLTYYVGIVGPSSAGKSAAAAVAGELLPAPDHILDRLPIGSGEGFVDILFDLVTEEGENGKKRKVKRQTRHAAIFHIDEGAVLADLGNRQGTTLLPTLRTAYSHGTLGNTNASSETKRVVDGKTYVYGVTLGIQPEWAGPLLADVAAGTPQRFVWVTASDTHAPDTAPDWPGELDWQPPPGDLLRQRSVIRGGQQRFPLGVHPDIAKTIIDDRRATVRGETVHDAADAHRMLSQLKTAALLALLDKRVDVGPDDWHLAETIATTSRRIRQAIAGTLAALDAGKENAALERHARRELHVEQTKEARVLGQAAKAIANVVHRHKETGEHAPSGCVAKCVRNATNHRHRQVVTVDEAISEAERLRWIVRDGDLFLPGDSRPT